MNIPLEQPVFLFLIPLGLLAVGKLVRQKSRLGFSSATLLKGIETRAPLLLLERLFLSLFVVTGALILARPTKLIKNSVPVYSEARDLILVLDISGSMTGDNISTAKSVITGFVEGRPQDRIALLTFNSDAFLEWPLSLDHEALVYRLNQLEADGSTIIASGVIAGIKHQQQLGQNPGALIVVSDGGSDVTPEEKTAIETSLGQTKLYWIWINEEGEADEMAQKFGAYVTSLGGQIFRGGIKDLDDMFRQINKLEASPVLYEQHVTTAYHFGILPLLALGSVLLAGLVNIVREV